PESHPQLRFRHHHGGLGTIALARQRAARLVRLASGGPAGFAQCRRHQGSRGGCPDRAHYLCQEPRRSGGGMQGDGPRPALEFLLRPAVRLRISALRALGSLQLSRSITQIWRFRIPEHLVVGRRKGSKDRKAQLKDKRMAHLNRRHVLGLGLSALSAVGFRPAIAASEAGNETHGMSVFGDLKYPADFKHFDYVNPEAPKGGFFSTIPSTRAYNQSFQTFNSFNAFILKGEGAKGMELTFDSLMARANDEPDAMYGLAAKSVWISPDKLTYRFTMRREARFHDGSKLTAHDVAFSLNILKEKG